MMNADFIQSVPTQERKMVVGGKPLLRDAWSPTSADAKGLDEKMNSGITGGTDTALNGSTRITINAKSASSCISNFSLVSKIYEYREKRKIIIRQKQAS